MVIIFVQKSILYHFQFHLTSFDLFHSKNQAFPLQSQVFSISQTNQCIYFMKQRSKTPNRSRFSKFEDFTLPPETSSIISRSYSPKKRSFSSYSRFRIDPEQKLSKRQYVLSEFHTINFSDIINFELEKDLFGSMSINTNNASVLLRKQKKKISTKTHNKQSNKGRLEKLQEKIDDKSLFIKSKPIIMKASKIKIQSVQPKSEKTSKKKYQPLTYRTRISRLSLRKERSIANSFQPWEMEEATPVSIKL